MSSEERMKDVFELMAVGDLVFAKVTALNASGLLLNVQCFANLNISPDAKRPWQRKAR